MSTLLNLLLLLPTANPQQERATQVKQDRSNFARDKFWIYDDLEKGIAKAKATGRPMLVVFR